ncbi:phosphoadenosine phosphosulfate reductase domain-containing protein [Paenibacillus glucanolyticus]|uniref:phosphoadenosine phosphosulfate reductase domain-containing protein n=1 Tax=Paenibacillus glucanolyticus TaxID=59843 RepID=UPI0015C2DE84|nr:phosphoadenosine phosphosulfate reductase family protein [Paenibacillus glucanolyticus]
MQEAITEKYTDHHTSNVEPINRIIFFSGGIASFAAANWVKETYPNDNIVLYFTDTHWEHPDLYRFNEEASDKLQLPLLTHSCGLNPIQLMFEKKMIYNSMIGDCSKILKMKVSKDFLKKGVKPENESWRNREYLKNENFTTDAVLYFGIGFDEMHRESAIKKNWQPFRVEMPLIENNIWKDEALKKYNIRQPKLYDYGFAHNNCFGRCVKAGQGHYKLLKEQMPDVFQKLMEQEHHLKICVSAYRYIIDDKVPEHDRIPEHVREQMLQELDNAYRDYFYDRASRPKIYIHPSASANHHYAKIKQYSFLKKTGSVPEHVTFTTDDGQTETHIRYPKQPYPLRDLNYEIENDMQIDLFDIGGCGCFVEEIAE